MVSLLKRYPAITIGIFFLGIWMLVWYLFSILNLWGDMHGCAIPGNDPCFCEYADAFQLIAEPINAWSNFYYIGAGFIILIYHDLERNEKISKREDYLSKEGNTHYAVAYGILVVWIGIGSFLMHAVRRGNTSYLDVMSMNTYICGVLVMAISIRFNLKKEQFYMALFFSFFISEVLSKFFGHTYVFVGIVILVFINEMAISLGIYSKVFKKHPPRNIKPNFPLLFVIVGLFLLAFYVWQFGHTEHPYCDPYSLWQWHTVWHFLTAVCTVLIFLYIKLEKEKELTSSESINKEN